MNLYYNIKKLFSILFPYYGYYNLQKLVFFFIFNLSSKKLKEKRAKILQRGGFFLKINKWKLKSEKKSDMNNRSKTGAMYRQCFPWLQMLVTKNNWSIQVEQWKSVLINYLVEQCLITFSFFFFLNLLLFPQLISEKLCLFWRQYHWIFEK